MFEWIKENGLLIVALICNCGIICIVVYLGGDVFFQVGAMLLFMAGIAAALKEGFRTAQRICMDHLEKLYAKDE